MTAEAGAVPPASGAGGLLTTEVLYAELGEHGGRRLRGRVERRVLRLALGQRLRVSVTRLRPVAVEVHGGTEAFAVAIAPQADPLAQAMQRVLLLWVVSMVVRRAAAVLRGGGKAAQRGRA